MNILPENTSTFGEYYRLTRNVLLIAFLLLVGVHIISPYLSAHKETSNILSAAGIPESKRSTKAYHNQTFAALQKGCTYGVDETSVYNMHCIVDSPLTYWKSNFLQSSNKYQSKSMKVIEEEHKHPNESSE